MNRRTYLAGVAAASSTATLGCLDAPTADSESASDGDSENGDDERGNGGEDARLPTELVESRLVTQGVGDVPDADEPPVIHVDESEATVIIEGTITYSSSTCGEVMLDRATYDPGSGAAHVRVAGRTDREEGEPCTDDVVTRSYRVALAFDRGVPETVEAVEAGNVEEFVVTY